MFSYYCQFIKSFSDKIQPLVKVDRQINSDTEITFYQLKKDIEASVVTSTDDTLSFVVETDASQIPVMHQRIHSVKMGAQLPYSLKL